MDRRNITQYTCAAFFAASLLSCSQTSTNPGPDDPGGGGSTTGQLSIWTDQTAGTIALTIDGVSSGSTTKFFTGTPSCGQTGTVTITLTAGSHHVVGSGGGGAWDKTVTVVAGTCTLLALPRSGAVTTGQLSIWTDNPNGTLNVSLDGVPRGALTTHSTSGPPACGSAGTLTLTAEAGQHLVYATGTAGGTWSKTPIAVAGACTLVQLEAIQTPTTGQLTVWSDQTTGSISVSVDGVPSGTITTHSTSAPQCGGSSGLTLTLSAGDHVITATSSLGGGWGAHTSTVIAGSCISFGLLAGTQATTGDLVIWTDLPTGTINVSVDGVSRGTLFIHYTSNPGCNAIGGILITLSPGNHQVTATYSGGGAWSVTVPVVAGVCNALDLTSSNQSTSTTGQLTLWKTYTLDLTAKVDGVTVGTLTQFISVGTPPCGAAGTITLNLAPGTHTISGVGADGRHWDNYSAPVTAGGCTRFQFQ